MLDPGGTSLPPDELVELEEPDDVLDPGGTSLLPDEPLLELDELDHHQPDDAPLDDQPDDDQPDDDQPDDAPLDDAPPLDDVEPHGQPHSAQHEHPLLFASTFAVAVGMHRPPKLPAGIEFESGFFPISEPHASANDIRANPKPLPIPIRPTS